MGAGALIKGGPCQVVAGTSGAGGACGAGQGQLGGVMWQ